MALTDHLDTLDAYQATAARVVGRDGEIEDQLGAGGGLAERYEALGRAPLVSVLRDPSVASVLLADGTLEVELRREGGDALLMVRWGAAVAVQELVPIPAPHLALHGPLFRPDPSSAAGPEALEAVEQELFVVEGDRGEPRWYRRGLHGPGLGARPLLARIPPFHDTARRAETVVLLEPEVDLAQLEALVGDGFTVLLRAGRRLRELAEERIIAAVARLGTDRIGLALLSGDLERGVELAHRLRLQTVLVEGAGSIPLSLARYRLGGEGEAPALLVAPRGDPSDWLRPLPAHWISRLLEEGVLRTAGAVDAARLPGASVVFVPPDEVLRTRQRASRLAAAGDHLSPKIGGLGGGGAAGLWCAYAVDAPLALLEPVGPSPHEVVTAALRGAALYERRVVARAQGVELVRR